MTDNYIQVHEDYILRVGIKDANGNDTSNVLTFNLMDVELLLKLQEANKQHDKNYNYYQNQLTIINKKEDHRGKFLLSSNEEAKIKAQLDFFEKEEKALDLFLGEGGTKKVLNGRAFNEYTFNLIIDEIKPIITLLKNKQDLIIKTIKEKYEPKNKEVLQ